MATLIPNSFQHPNILIDKLDYFLTPEESKVLSKAVREILGWEDKIEERKAPISLTVFVEGKFKKGKRVAYGCGLGLQAVRNALASLHEFGVLVKVGQPTQDGQWYWLQDDESQIDWQGLEARRAKWDADNAKRTKKATKRSLQSRGVTSDVRGNVGRKAGVTSDVTKGVTSDVNKETQPETQLETQKGGDASLPPICADSHDPTDLPEAEAQMALLFPSGGSGSAADFERSIIRAGWEIRSNDIRRAAALFLKASGLPIPNDDSTRGDWIKSLRQHVKDFGVAVLAEIYQPTVTRLREKDFPVGRPGSVTKTLPVVLTERKNGGKHARSAGQELDEQSQAISAALAARARGGPG